MLSRIATRAVVRHAAQPAVPKAGFNGTKLQKVANICVMGYIFCYFRNMWLDAKQ